MVDGQAVTSLAGTDQGNRGVLTLESPEVAEEIAHHVAAAMLNRAEPSRFVLGPLDTNDPRVHAFAAALPGAQLVAVDPIPVIEQVEPRCSVIPVSGHATYVAQGQESIGVRTVTR